MCDMSFKMPWENCSNLVCILLLPSLVGIWWSSPHGNAVYSSVDNWYEETFCTVLLILWGFDSIVLTVWCLRKLDNFFWYRLVTTLHLLFKATFSWWNTVFQMIKFTLLFSVVHIFLISFLSFHFSECLFCISASMIWAAIFFLSLKLTSFNDTFTLVNVGISRSFLHVFI